MTDVGNGNRTLTIGVVGGVPASLGGGGLERQIRETRAALVRRGHKVFHVASAPTAQPFDVLHAFGAEPDVCHLLSHWRLNPAPLVISPVVVVPPRRVRLERMTARVPLSTWGPRMRAQALRRAQLVVAQSDHEAALLRHFGASRVEVVPNGVTREAVGVPPSEVGTEPYFLLVGTVNNRKRQTATVTALSGLRPVVVGGFEGTAKERSAFLDAIDRSGGLWLGEIRDRGTLLGLITQARAVVQLSRAEGQSLALLEALSVGTRVVASRLPPTEELAARHPDHVHLVRGLADLPVVARNLAAGPSTPVHVPTWDDVAKTLDPLYRSVLACWRASPPSITHV